MSDIEESNNYYRLIRLLVKTGTRVLREVFKKHTVGNIASVLNNHNTIIKALRFGNTHMNMYRKVLTDPQYQLLIDKTPDLERFDITLLAILIQYICTSVQPPIGGWKTVMVPSMDTTNGGYILRIRNIRNEFVGHAPDTKVPNGLFKKTWDEAEICIKALAVHVNISDEIDKEIKTTKVMTMHVNTEGNEHSKMHITGENMSASDKECDNYYRLMTLVVKVGTRTIREVFRKKHAGDIASILKSHRKTFDNFRKTPELTETQYQHLIANNPDLEKFDISLLVFLVNNICTCNDKSPGNGWNAVLRCIYGISNIRKKLVFNVSNTRVSDDAFNENWAEAEKCLKDLAADVGKYDEIAEEIRNTESMPLTVDSHIILEVTPWLVENLYTELCQLNKKVAKYSTHLQTRLKNVSDIRTVIKGDQHTKKSRSSDQQTAPVVEEYILHANKEMDQTKDKIDDLYDGVCKAFELYKTQQQETEALPSSVNPNVQPGENLVEGSKK